MIELVVTHDHEEVRIARSSAAGVHGIELRLVGETMAARKAVRGRRA
jgi:hypothetical protein